MRQDVGRFVFVSTTDVYGMRDFHGETEDDLDYDPRPRNPYPKYKILSEKWIAANLPKDRYSIVRPAAVWGDDDPSMTKRVRDFLGWSPYIVHFGKWKGRNRWPKVHVDTVAKANYLAATLPEAAGEAFHVLDEEWTSVDEFYRFVAERFFPEQAVQNDHTPTVDGHLLRCRRHGHRESPEPQRACDRPVAVCAACGKQQSGFQRGEVSAVGGVG